MGADRSCSPRHNNADISVLIVVDVRLYREELSTSLGRREQLAVLGEADSREAALALVASNPPDVVVLDMATRDSLAIVRDQQCGAERQDHRFRHRGVGP
jgi:DNA-binding NarL/FixJ family response regulator